MRDGEQLEKCRISGQFIFLMEALANSFAQPLNGRPLRRALEIARRCEKFPGSEKP